MFDDGKMLILSQADYDWVMSQHPTGNTLTSLTLDDEPRDWYVEPLNPLEWQSRPDVLAYIQRQKHADADAPAS